MTAAARERPDISVVLATYDRRASLPRAIASVLAQEGAAFELIVVDDGSCDGTRDYLATLADPRLTLSHKPPAPVHRHPSCQPPALSRCLG